MNSSRMVTIATFLLLLSSSSRAFPDDAAQTSEARRRPGSAAPKGYAGEELPTSPREPAHIDQETWPTWLEAVADTQATGRPTVIVVTSRKAARSTSYVEGLRGDLWLARLRRDRTIEFAELSAEEAAEQLSRLRINTFPTIIAYRRGARGLEAAGRHQGIMPAPQLLGWLQGLGLVPALEDDGGPARELGSASNRDSAGKAQMANKDQSLKAAAYDDAYATPQSRASAPQYPTCPAPPYYGNPTKSAPPQVCAPPQQAPTYQIVTLPQAAPPQAAPPQAVPVTIVPQQMAAPPAQPTYIIQQAPQQAAPVNLLTVAAAPTQPVAMAAPTQAAPTQAVIMAAPTQVAAAPTQTYYMAAPTQMVAAAPVQYVAAAPVQYVAAAPTQLVAAAPGGGAGLSLGGLNLPGLNLSLRPPGTFDRFVGRIGKRLHTRSYPRVAIDIESLEAANELNEKECVPAKRPSKRHADEDEDETPPPRRRPPVPYYDNGPAPSPQNNYPPTPSGQRP